MDIANRFALLLLIITAVVLWLYMDRAKKGIYPKIRRIPALDAIEEAVGRAVEMGRPVYFPIGASPVGGAWTGGNIAALSMIRHSGSIAAKMGIKQLVGTTRTELIPMVDDVMKSAYTEAGAPELYEFEDIRYFPSQFAMISGTQGMYYREPPGAQIMIGTWFAETLSICEIARRGGAFMIGGTDYRPYMPYMLATCDYALIGEEIFVASAYVSDDPDQKASVGVEDVLKWITLTVTVLAALAYVAGFPEFLVWLSR